MQAIEDRIVSEPIAPPVNVHAGVTVNGVESKGETPRVMDLIRPGDVVELNWHDGVNNVNVLQVLPGSLKVACPDSRYDGFTKKGEPILVTLDIVKLDADLALERAHGIFMSADPFYALARELNGFSERLSRLTNEDTDCPVNGLDRVVFDCEAPKANAAIGQLGDALLAMSRASWWLAG